MNKYNKVGTELWNKNIKLSMYNYVVNAVASNRVQLSTEKTAVSIKFWIAKIRFESYNCWQRPGGIGERLLGLMNLLPWRATCLIVAVVPPQPPRLCERTSQDGFGLFSGVWNGKSVLWKNLKTSERKELSTPDLLGHYFSVMYSCRWPVNVLPVIKARRENAH